MIPTGKVFLISGVTDMRKSIDGLSLIVAETLEMDPFSESWFISRIQIISATLGHVRWKDG
ncbi:IS66 family insertion sequence element accessory protein TnpB [Providencia stuartii]